MRHTVHRSTTLFELRVTHTKLSKLLSKVTARDTGYDASVQLDLHTRTRTLRLFSFVTFHRYSKRDGPYSLVYV